MEGSEREEPAKPARPSPLACIECRKKHLKCDAATPQCARCRARGLQCSYTPSRRGITGRSRRAPTPMGTMPQYLGPVMPPTPTQEHAEYMTASYDYEQTQMPTPAASRTEFRTSSTTIAWAEVSAPPRIGTMRDVPSAPSAASTPASTSSHASLRSEDERLTNLFYNHFHPSHPMLVPRRRFYSQAYPEHLRAVVHFVGSHYTTNITSDNLRHSTEMTLGQHIDKTPETVQALLLFAIALHARYEPIAAMSALAQAAELAITLGMHHAQFASTLGQDDAIYAESLRRTWWEVYITDANLAAFHRNPISKCAGVTPSALLPCEDSTYEEGIIPQRATTLQHFDARQFSEEEMHFSSLAYRVGATRILSRVMAVSTTNDARADVVQAIDDAIVGWTYHLPGDKATVSGHSGEIDSIMFQAFTIINCASIFLHFPRSEYAIATPSTAEIACAQRYLEQVSPTSSQHGIKAVAAARELGNLATLPLEKRSPFFICAMVFASIVQLSVCATYQQHSTDQNRERVTLLLGAIKSMNRNWPLAGMVGTQLRKAANQVFNAKEIEVSSAPTSSSYDSAVDFSANMQPPEFNWVDFLGPMSGPLLPPGDPMLQQSESLLL